MVEAFLGAIFVVSGFDFRVVEDFFTSHLRWHFEDMRVYDTFANKHPTVGTPLLTADQGEFWLMDFRLICTTD